MKLPARSSALLRSALALLLVCAQIFAAAHAVGHVGDLASLARGDTLVAQATRDGGVPAAERHEACLLCLAAADLVAALPPAVPVLDVDVQALTLPAAPDLLPGALRLPRPHARGPPTFS
ncbi:hypothetical protein [Zoogloea sp.]|uniref:hypothetical protein n=1 Tax=Zoogloea sp. TaxID=49181 RepID=UPI0025E58425|nr:hypothetical protein [Zoogloea sp.]MCK6394668.1 hypothetical protein [Zoogloea sp.]